MAIILPLNNIGAKAKRVAEWMDKQFAEAIGERTSRKSVY